MYRLSLIALMAGLWLSGCRTTEVPYAVTLDAQPAVLFTAMTDSIPPDPAMAAIVNPYRDRLQDEIETVIGEAAAPLAKGGLESALGNFAADAMLTVVQDLTDRPVDMALTNNGGLRIPIPEGPITVGRMFELMPFENMMVVLDLSAAMVDTLAQQLSRGGAEPIAGFSFMIGPNRQAVDVRVDDRPLDPNRTYRLVTSDYLAGGGGRVPALWTPLDREDLSYLLRDSFIEYLRQIQVIEPTTDGRITFQTGTSN